MLFEQRKIPERSLLLVILDGWGEAPAWGGNAITNAHKPTFDHLHESAYVTSLAAAGSAVGLADGEPGNSEVGHLTIGAGRVLIQDRARISAAIDDGRFFTNPQLIATINRVKATGRTLHLIGLASQGGVHGHSDHLRALLELAKQHGLTRVAIHAITDGRDAPPQQAASELDRIRHWCTELGVGTVASVMGRYWAMDRDQHWDRTERAITLLTQRLNASAQTPLAAISAAYSAGQTDEFIEPTWIDPAINPIGAGDTLICWNYRPDRSRQLIAALADPHFRAFKRPPLPDLSVTTLTSYWPANEQPTIQVAFPLELVADPLGSVVSAAGYGQLRIAESEKYAHITYFLNGGCETPFDLESRQLIPSRLQASPAEQPGMQTLAIAAAAAHALEQQRFGLIVINIAAPDMVGHTGDLQATVRACEVVDRAIGKILESVRRTKARLIITADHGNAEQLVNPVTNEPDTHHTVNPVPFIAFDPTAMMNGVSRPTQTLVDVAPTALALLGLAVPAAMTGLPLVTGATHA